MRHIHTMIILLGVLFQFLAAQTPKLDTQEFPLKELKKQNIQIAALAAKEMSKTLPQKVDRYTTVTSIINDKNTLVYTFVIDTGKKSDATVQKEDHSRMQKAITTGVCKTSEKFLLAGIDTLYIYKSEKTGRVLFRFKITQEKCPNLTSR
ncbi:hypothetical protein FJR45_11295 [Sulfurimonas sediminis]|uniref:Uncharacterized protein n=1 Tax=Sulfurimonas sediminis TaxID=2590020 RepID=A0A7M1B436_9BACT|nr:hypothetical protein [Sulfurimonas sediminis]QOP44499.1 hypothetical protein FJR45_11295 [Sulfurimonas sediminis]